ncbi:TPA: hypothetical protein PXO03_001087 [Yersinia enterocolitica]|nr:hypothetical protein [Yersinia enterocolitica]HDL7465133.1 hypothetical protein [Yersinia enterocolitica]
MAIYKVQYESIGRYWDFNMESNTPLSAEDDSVFNAARRDSAASNIYSGSNQFFSIRIVMVTEVI